MLACKESYTESQLAFAKSEYFLFSVPILDQRWYQIEDVPHAMKRALSINEDVDTVWLQDDAEFMLECYASTLFREHNGEQLPDIKEERKQMTRRNRYHQPKAKKLAMSLDIWETTLEDYYKLGGTVIWSVEETLIVVNTDKAEMDSLAATGDVVFVPPRRKPGHYFKEVCFAKRVDITPLNWMQQDLWEDLQYYQRPVYH